jgi:hypothetical protein
MANQTLSVTLTARDGVSAVFKRVGLAAQQAGQQAQQAAQRASKSQTDWGQTTRALGAGFTAFTLLSTRANAQAEASQARLDSAITATGHTMDEYADQLAEASRAALQLGFDDEDAADAIATLTAVTGDAAIAIEDLSLAEDIARARRIDLAAATKIVAAIETGRYGSLARLGIQIDENASREEALAAVQAKVAGQAEAYAETSAAAHDRIRNSIENMLEGAGEQLAQFQIPLLAVSSAGTAFGPIISGIGKTGAAAKAASLATSGLGLAMGPLGIAAAAAAGAAGIYLLIKSLDNTDTSLTESTGNLNSLKDILAELAATGTSTAITQQIAGFSDELQGVAQSTVDARTELEAVRAAGLDYADMVTNAVARGDDAAAEAGRRQLEMLNARAEALDRAILQEDEWLELQKDLAAIFSDPNPLNQGIVAKRVQELFDEFARTGDVEALVWNLNWLNDNSKTYGLTLEEVAAQQVDTNNALAEGAVGAETLAANMKEAATQNTAARDASKQLNDELITLAGTLQRDFPGAAASAYDQVVTFTQGMVDAIGTSAEWARSLEDHLHGQNAFNDITRDGTLDAEDYNEVTRERAEIIDSLARATAAANEIQVKQIDIVSEGADATADYLENIADLPEAEQALALAWADSDVSGRAMEVLSLADSFGEMGAAQQQAFGDMVTSAAATDPQLARILENAGLIKKSLTDPTGWELVIDSEQSESDTDRLIDAVNSLTNAILGVPDISVDAALDTGEFWKQWNALPNQKTIVVYTRQGGVVGPTPEAALGGIVDYDAAAVGRMSRDRAILVGEHGPELALLPGGTQVIPNHASREMMRGGGMSFAGANFNFYGVQDPQGFMVQMRDYSATMERR